MGPLDEGKDIVEGPLVYEDSVIVSLVGRYKTFTYPIPDGALCYSIPLRNCRNGWANVNIGTHGVPPCCYSARRVDGPLALLLASLSSLVTEFCWRTLARFSASNLYSVLSNIHIDILLC